MPTYEYRCPDGHDFEHFFRKISDAPAEFACPICGAIAERRMSAGAGLVFKGSGFYLTDYGRNAHRTSGPESSGSESKGESKGEPKADSKSESSGDAKSPSKSDGAKSDNGGSATPKAESSGGTAKAEPAKTPKNTESKPSSGKTKGGSSE
jgi:putative FmdB family regulatory protein